MYNTKVTIFTLFLTEDVRVTAYTVCGEQRGMFGSQFLPSILQRQDLLPGFAPVQQSPLG